MDTAVHKIKTCTGRYSIQLIVGQGKVQGAAWQGIDRSVSRTFLFEGAGNVKGSGHVVLRTVAIAFDLKCLTHVDDTVKDVLEHRCIHCHHDSAINGGLNFQDRASLFASGGNGPFIVPGKPQESKVWQAIFRPKTHPNTMPGDGWGLTQAQTEGFLKWIETGAYWPEGKAGKLKIRKYEIQLDDYL